MKFKCSFWCWCFLILRCTIVSCRYGRRYVSRIENNRKYPYKYFIDVFIDDNPRKYSVEKQARYYDVAHRKQVIRQQEQTADADIPVDYQWPFAAHIASAITRISRSIRYYLHEFSENMLPKQGAIARIISAISNANPITDTCVDHSGCTGDSNICLMGRCVCGMNGSKCSRTNPTCDHETGTCQCGAKKNKWGGPYNFCYLGQICTVSKDRGKCHDADVPK